MSNSSNTPPSSGSGSSAGQGGNDLAEALIREASAQAVARSSWLRRKQSAAGPVAPTAPAAPAATPPAPVEPAAQASPLPPAPPPPPDPAVPPPGAPAEYSGATSSERLASVLDAEPLEHAPGGSMLAVFCFEGPAGPLTHYLHNALPALAQAGVPVHLFTRAGQFPELATADCGVHYHGVNTPAPGGATELLHAVEEFSRAAHDQFEELFGERARDVVLLGSEWSGIHAALGLSAAFGLRVIFSLHSLEAQRSDMTSALSRDIQEIERLGLRQSDAVLLHSGAAGGIARNLAPESAARQIFAVTPFPADDFAGELDAGEVKTRYQVGPVDPLLLFVGNFDHRHGPDIMVKAIPAILRNHRQARFVLVGEGDLLWPMRVHARYLLLEYAVRFTGHLEGQQLRDLIKAANVVCVPSRERTEDWPVLAAWAAGKPVLATHEAGAGLLEHDRNALLIYPQENSFVWGAEKLLFEEPLRNRLAEAGRAQLAGFTSWSGAAQQLAGLLQVTQ